MHFVGLFGLFGLFGVFVVLVVFFAGVEYGLALIAEFTGCSSASAFNSAI
jgi:hypothetical protein